jgi:hypothetical protein
MLVSSVGEQRLLMKFLKIRNFWTGASNQLFCRQLLAITTADKTRSRLDAEVNGAWERWTSDPSNGREVCINSPTFARFHALHNGLVY